MMTGTKLQQNGRKFFLALAFFLSSCRTGTPAPVIEVCIGDGVGGSDCVEADHTKKYRLPSEMKNYWCTNEADEARWSSWAYRTNLKNVLPAMKLVKESAQSPETSDEPSID